MKTKWTLASKWLCTCGKKLTIKQGTKVKCPKCGMVYFG